MITDDADREQALRDKAVRQLKKQRDFRSHQPPRPFPVHTPYDVVRAVPE